MPVNLRNCLTDASARFEAWSERMDSGMPKMAKVTKNAKTTSIDVSALHACSMTYRDLSSCMHRILVAPVNSHAVLMVRKSMCHLPNKGASVRIDLYIAYGRFCVRR